MRIIYKLSLGYVAVALLIALVGYFAGGAGQRALRGSIGGVSRRLAGQIIDEVDRHMYSRIEQFQAYTKTRLLQETVAQSNREFEQLDDIQAYISQMDAEWTKEPRVTATPLMLELMGSRLSEEFRDLVKFYHDKYGYRAAGELFVTNKYGANVAQSGRTTDYRQDDEEWWQRAKEEGLVVEDVQYDESAEVYSTDIAVRIDDENGEFIGVLKVVLNIQEAIDIITEAQSRYMGEPRQARVYRLLDEEKRMLYSTETFRLFEDGSRLLPDTLDSPLPVDRSGTFVRHDEEKEDLLCAYARSEGHRDFKGLGWIVLLEHDMQRRYAPARELRGRILLTSLLIAVVGVGIGGAISVSLSKRIGRLRKGTEIIGAGNLDYKVGTKAKDEIGELARAFDAMTERLKETTVSRDELAKEVEERKLAEAELARSNADLEQFAYVASHDLQEPLRMVASYMQLLERRYEGKLDKDADAFIAYAVDGAKRIQKMINDLLAYSRVGTHGREFEATESESAFEYAVANLEQEIEESGGRVTHDPLPAVMADPTQLVQVFQNLIGNAVKFQGESPPRAHVSARKQGREWVFSVSDNGIGFDPKYSERVFIVFKRLHPSSEYGGTGIGLAICKRIVERHGGRMWVSSEPGKGSTFYFTLPAVEDRSRGGGSGHKSDGDITG